MPNAAIVGAGLIGRSWAVVFARAGWAVRLTDLSAEALAAAPGLIRQALDDLKTHGLVDDPAAAAARVAPAASLAEAVASADLVQENGPETVEAKRAIFADLDRLAPPAPRSSLPRRRSSPLPSSPMGCPVANAALIGHPVNPPHLVPVVELCGAPWTAPEVIARARDLYALAGTGADHGQSRDPRLRSQPPARGAARRGIPAGRRGRGQPAGPRCDTERRTGPALVLHGAVRDH